MRNVEFKVGDVILGVESKRVVRVVEIRGRLLVLKPVNFTYEGNRGIDNGCFTFSISQSKFAISSGHWRKLDTQAEKILYVGKTDF